MGVNGAHHSPVRESLHCEHYFFLPIKIQGQNPQYIIKYDEQHDATRTPQTIITLEIDYITRMHTKPIIPKLSPQALPLVINHGNPEHLQATDIEELIINELTNLKCARAHEFLKQNMPGYSTFHLDNAFAERAKELSGITALIAAGKEPRHYLLFQNKGSLPFSGAVLSLTQSLEREYPGIKFTLEHRDSSAYNDARERIIEKSRRGLARILYEEKIKH